MHKLIQFILLSILLTACGPASAATSAPATETVFSAKQVTPSLIMERRQNTTTATQTSNEAPTFDLSWRENLSPGQYLLTEIASSDTDGFYLLSKDGKTAVKVFSRIPVPEGVSSVLSPTLDKVAYMEIQGTILYIKDLKTNTITQLPIGDCSNNITWSPDSKKIALSCHGGI